MDNDNHLEENEDINHGNYDYNHYGDNIIDINGNIIQQQEVLSQNYILTLTNRNQMAFNHHGYSYRKSREVANFPTLRVTFKCRTKGCSATLFANCTMINEGTFVIQEGTDDIILFTDIRFGVNHNHSPNPNFVVHELARKRIQALVVSGDMSYSEAYHHIVSTATDSMTIVNPHAVSTFIKLDSLRKTMSRIAARLYPRSPESALTLGIPNNWKHLNRNENIQEDLVILIDSVIPNPLVSTQYSELNYRILVFGTTDLFTRLMANPIWLIYETFTVAPKIFNQLLIIHCFIGERAIPCAYCLLQRKAGWMYTALFEAINTKSIELGYTVVMDNKIVKCDFEPAIRRSISDVFPNFIMQGCHFHYCQCLYRYVCHYLHKKVFYI
jgi:hypothetical protein